MAPPKIVVLVILYSQNPNGRFDSVFSLGVITIKNQCPLLSPFGGFRQGEGPT